MSIALFSFREDALHYPLWMEKQAEAQQIASDCRQELLYRSTIALWTRTRAYSILRGLLH